MSYRTGSHRRYHDFLQKNGGKDVILDRTLLSSHLFPTKEWRRRRSSWTGPCQLSMS